MHKITDKLHHKRATAPVSPLSTNVLPQATLATQQPILHKEYVSNAQGALVQPAGFQKTTTTTTVETRPLQQTTFAHVPVTSVTQQAPILTTQQLAQQQLVQQQLHQEQIIQQQLAQQQFAQQQLAQQQLSQQQLAQQQFAQQQYTQQQFVQQEYTQQQFVQQGLTQNIETVHVHTLPTVVETRVRPAIIEQTTRIEKITEIQPVVHREIEQPRHHILEKHIYETVPSVGPSVVTNQAIVEEVVRPRVMEQIQPVLHREVPAPFIERVEEHITEHVVQPTTTTKQVLSETRALSLEEAASRGYNAPVLPVASQTPIVHTTTAAPLLETHTRGAIVEQTTRAEKITEIQPVIHREIEAPEVHLIEKHMYEKVRSEGPSLVTNQAIVQETVRPHIIEQIQPIVHRSVPAPFVERVEEHINEKVVAPTQTTKEVLSETKLVAPVVIAEQKAIGAPIVNVTEAAPVIESRTRSAIVEQTSRPEKITEVQPIIHREIEAPEVHVIEKHMYEKVRSAGPSVVTAQPIVQETVTPHIVEQIQPIVHRSVPAPFIEKVEQHTTEKVVAPTQTTKEVLTERTVAAPVQISQQREIGAPIVQRTEAAPVLESRTRSALVEQTMRPEKITEVQPIIHREIEAPEVHVIEKHMYEKVRSTGPSVVTAQPIVQETVTPHIVEQIQPIVHRSVPAPFVEKVEQHTTEKVVAPTQTTKQVLTERTVAAPVQISQQREIGAPIVQRTEAAPVLESRTRSALVEQTMRPEKITQVQPIIHREIEAPEVHVIEKHSYESVRSAGPHTVTRGAIVEETVIPRVIEEIQPIIHREVPQAVVERVEQHVNERVVAPTQTSKQVVSEQRVGAAVPIAASLTQRSTTPIVRSSTAQTVTESVTRPTLVEQTTRAEKITEVQPIIHREIEAPEVHVIEQHVYEKVPSQGPSLITNQAIVQETVRPHIVEEIQPVVHRNVPVPVVERVEQHVTERLVQPTLTTKQVLVEKNSSVLPGAAPLASAVAAGGPGNMGRTTTTTTTTTITQPLEGAVQEEKKHGLRRFF